jgi:NAD(P)-dependent dehydrogenase (short-subunit alcohol dehydrogenase family)
MRQSPAHDAAPAKHVVAAGHGAGALASTTARLHDAAGAGLCGEAGHAPCCASKFGLEGLTQCLAAEWRPFNIAVNTLSPGMSVLTDALTLKLRRRDPELQYARPEMLAPPAVFPAQQDASGVIGRHIEAFHWVQEHGPGG